MVRELLREESDAADARRHRAVRPTDIAEPEASPASGDPAAATPAEFRCEGESWTISFAGHTARVRETKGFLYLALLLRHPGEPVHVTELVNLKGPATQPADAPGVPKDGSLAVRSGLGDAGVILDAQAKQDYRRRLAELRSELDQAQEFHDRGRVERARQEIEFLTQELAGAIGLGGRDRRTGSHSERARINVSRSIARAIERLEASHPDLARHLSRNIRTGTFCVYGPDPTLGEVWRL
jgi:non-specific serine/threonine protein kinase